MDNVKEVLSKIIKIEPRIHQFRCSCPTHWQQIPFSGDDFDHKMSPYQVSKKSTKYIDGLKLKSSWGEIEILYNPKWNILPGAYITLSNPRPFDLLFLIDKFKDLNVSSVEYAIDFHCSSPNEVRELYYQFKKYIVLKGKRRSFKKHKDKPFKQYYEDDLEKNFSCYFDGNFKMYERGQDEKKLNYNSNSKGKGWRFTDISFLRLEFIARRYYVKKKLGKPNFNEFIDDCKFGSFFSNIFLKRLLFMKINPQHKRLLREMELYRNGIKPELQDNLMHYKYEKGIKFNQLIEADQFRRLKLEIPSAVKKYIRDWEHEALDYRRTLNKKWR